MNGWNEINNKREELQKELNSHVSYICLRISMGQEPDEDDWKSLLSLERKFRNQESY